MYNLSRSQGRCSLFLQGQFDEIYPFKLPLKWQLLGVYLPYKHAPSNDSIFTKVEKLETSWFNPPVKL